MPLYDASCKICGKDFEYSAKIKEMDDTPICCGVKSERKAVYMVLGLVDRPEFMKKYAHIY